MFFKCMKEGCELTFAEKKDRNDHYKEHERNKRPFECNKCKQCFTQISSLQKHARVHDKRKPYVCKYEDCGMAFTQASNLIRHERIHTGIKPYKCDKCDKSFASSSNLKQHKEIHQTDDDRSRFMCPLENCKKVYLYFSSLKKHMSKNHKDYYDTNFNQPTKVEIQSFKKMTSQYHAEVEPDKESLEFKDKNITEVGKRGENRRKAKNDALKKLHQMQLSSSNDEDRDDNELGQEKQEMDCAKKRVKVEEDKEVQIDRKNERTESMDVDEEMQKEKKSFEAYCKKVSKSEKFTENQRDHSVVKTIQKEEYKPEIEMPNQVFKPIPFSRPSMDDYYDQISKQFTSKTQVHMARNNVPVSKNNSDSVFLLKSMILQDLFRSAFRRYLDSSKHSLIQNLNNKLNEPVFMGNKFPKVDVFGRHSYPERKNTDAMSNETIETDLNNYFGTQSKGRSPNLMNKTLPLSSFYPSSKVRCDSLLTNVTKSHSLEGGHREGQSE